MNFQDRFPRWHAILTATPRRSYDGPGWGSGRLQRLEEAVDLCEQSHAAGHIANARWKEMAETMNRSIQRAWGQVAGPHQESLDRLPADIRERFMEIDSEYSGPTLASFHRFPKKLAALPDHPLKKAWQDLLAEVTPVLTQGQALKGMAVKRQPKDPSLDPAFQPPKASTAAEARVLALLEGILATAFDRLVSRIQGQYQAWLTSYTSGWEAAVQDPSLNRPGYNHYDPTWHFSSKTFADKRQHQLQGVDMQAVMIVRPVLDYQASSRRSYGPVTDASARLDAAAISAAEQVRNLFLHKNLRKIAAIVDAKGDDEVATATVLRNDVDLSGLEGTLRFTFHDGSAFTVRNAVVGVVNAQGTYFHRFPLTFHDVVLPDGTAMKSPSEERMNTVFAPTSPPSKPRAPR
jgi:hypothetical protein